MDATVPGNTPSTLGISGNGAGTLHKASSSAHAAVNSMAGAADDATRRVKPAIDRVSALALDRVSALALDRVSALAHHAVDKVAGAAAPTADWLTEQGETLNSSQKKLVDDTCSYVSANPLKSIGVALAAGFLLSRIIR